MRTEFNIPLTEEERAWVFLGCYIAVLVLIAVAIVATKKLKDWWNESKRWGDGPERDSREPWRRQ